MASEAVETARRRLNAAVAASRTGSAGNGASSVTVGLIGRGIQASKTPRMHEREGVRIGLQYTYLLIDFDELHLADGDLSEMIDEAERLGFAGVNVTHPFKQAVVAHLGALAPEAAAIGAVNTVVFGANGRVGHNTDCWGFAESFREGLPNAELTSVVQFGAGGAGAAVAHALTTLGVEHLTVCDTNLERAEDLASRLRERFDVSAIAVSDAQSLLTRTDGLVNATPVGMKKYPGVPFLPEALTARPWVAEIVYFPADTELLQLARSLGCRTLPGTGMAVYQAVKAFELFTGVAPDRAAMTEHFWAAA